MADKWRKDSDSGFITAHEIASFAFCPEAWRLQAGLGLESGNVASMAAGTRHHTRKGFLERLAGWLLLVGQLLAFLAGLWLVWWMGGW